MNPEQKKMAFDSYIEEYKDKSKQEKQNILVDELKELIVVVQKICIDKGIDFDLLVNREIVDINKEGYSDEDYLEAIYAYIQMFKEIFSSYLMSDYNDVE